MIASSVARPVARQVAKAVSAVGVSASLSDPSDPPPAGFTYLVDSDGAYIADSDNAWLLVPDTPEPDSIADLVLWLRASDLALADNAAVASWVSREGSDFDFVQATGAKQPTYKATSLINSQPAVSFDGGDLLVYAGVVSVANTGSIVVVCRRAADTTYQVLYGQSQGTAAGYMPFYHRHAAAKLVWESNAAGTAQSTELTTVDSNDLCIVSSSGSAITMRKNGINQAVTDGTSGTWFADNFFGNSSIGGLQYDVGNDVFFFSGLIAEIMIYEHKLTVDELVAIEAYVNERYGI